MNQHYEDSNPIALSSSDDDTDKKDKGIFWLQISFIIFAFLEGAIAGWIPTIWTSCRESPKILGIANSFACGLFLAISILHITPEEVHNWEYLDRNSHKDPGAGPDDPRIPNDKIFPLPELMVFFGYTIILIMDKVLFDSKALFENNDGEDPAKAKLERNIRTASF